MTGRREAFLRFYAGQARWNATEAARMAGYKDAHNEGWRLLRDEEVRAALSERLAEEAMAASEVLARLADQARGSLDDFVDEEDRVNLGQARSRGMMHLLKEYSCEEVYEGGGRERDPDLIRKQKIKLHDAQAALVQLGRHHGLFTDKIEASGPGGGPVRLEYVNDWRGSNDSPSLSPSGPADRSDASKET